MPSDVLVSAGETLGLLDPTAGRPAADDTAPGGDDRQRLIASSVFGALAVLAIGILDAMTGELRLSVLYVIVIVVMTWMNGRANGLLFAAASGVALVLANTAGDGRPADDPLFLVSAASDLLVFGFCAVGTNALRQVLFRERLRRRNLARYVPAPFVEQLANEGLGALKSRSCAATVMFIDIRGFTALAHALEPADVFSLLQSYRAIVTSAVRAHGGFVDKFVGDGVLAVFGVAGDPADSAACGVSAALEVLDRMDAWARRRRSVGRPTLKIGIGLHFGDVLVGAIGDDERLEFTVLGHTVNVAARIEDLTRDLALPLLVSDAVYAALPPAVRGTRIWAQLCVQGVRGIAGPLTLAYPLS
jgi:class 3 adenylate cyclase